MKKFNFRLDRFLKIKLALEKNQSFAIQRIENHVNQKKQEQVTLEKILEDYQRIEQSQSNSDINLPKIVAMMAYMELIDTRVSSKKEEINKLQAGLISERKKLLYLMRERRALESLKDNFFLTYKKEISKEFQKRLDDSCKNKSQEEEQRLKTNG
ncbi:MAG: flagellar export protein FliJ [Elusimicrobiota bacterium]